MSRKKEGCSRRDLRVVDLRDRPAVRKSRPSTPDVAEMLRALKSASEPKPAADQTPVAGPSRTLEMSCDPGETQNGMRAKTALRPTLRAAVTVAQFDREFGELDLTSLVGKLSDQVAAVQGGDLGRSEEMLTAQAHTLDMLFHKLVKRSINNGNAGYLDASETYMRLALRAQSQCRATLETLSVVKNPPAVAFVRQANIANGPQQVNNGTTAPQPSRAREIPQPELLEHQKNEWMDTRAPQATSGAHPAMATVGAINGTAHGDGQGPLGEERL